MNNGVATPLFSIGRGVTQRDPLALFIYFSFGNPPYRSQTKSRYKRYCEVIYEMFHILNCGF